MFSFITKSIEALGAYIFHLAPAIGRLTIYMSQSTLWFFRPPLRVKLFVEQMVFMGNKSRFIVGHTASFSGMVFAFQIYSGFTAFSVSQGESLNSDRDGLSL